jgi:hypothetical protein
MNKSTGVNLFVQSNQELLSQYEKLRLEALSMPRRHSEQSSGFAVLLLRGMASWIKIWSNSEQVQRNHCQYEASNVYHPLEDSLPCYPIQKEATIILTNMVLSHHEQRRSNYA